MRTKQELDELLHNVAVHCKTGEEANEVLELGEKVGYKWIEGQSFLTSTFYDEYKDETCYSIKTGQYGTLNYYQRIDYKVITAQEFIDLVNGKGMEQEEIKEQPQESVKNDRKDGKLRWELLPLSTIKEIVKVYTFGANKYGANRWQNLENGYERYKAALFRHMVAFEEGEITDKESGLHHLAHMAWNAIAMLYFAIKEGRK